MYSSLKFVIFLIVYVQVLTFIRTAPVNSTQATNLTVEQNLTASNSSASFDEEPSNDAAGCISLWDVDAGVITKSKKARDQQLKLKNNNIVQQKREIDLKKIVNKITSDNIDKEKQTRSTNLVNLVCQKTDKGFQCQNDDTEVVFNDPEITEDMIKDSVQALLSNGVLGSKDDVKKKKTRGCDRDDGSNAQLPQAEQGTLSPYQKHLAHLRDEVEEAIKIAEASPMAAPAMTVNSHFVKKTEPKQNQSELYLECSAEAGNDPPVYSCRWKSKKEDKVYELNST